MNMILALMISGFVPQSDPCVEALQRIYPVLKEYHATMGEMPGRLLDLYDTGFVDDPSLFYLKDSPEAGLAKLFPERAAPSFDLLTKEWSGDLLACGPLEVGDIFYLSADGEVRQGRVDPEEYYGRWHMPESSGLVTQAQLKKPWARLGVTLVEVPHDKGDKAVLVDSVIPGYESSFRTFGSLWGDWTKLRPGDRLIRVEGYKVENLAGLEKAFAFIKFNDGKNIVVLRDSRLCKTERLATFLDRGAAVKLPDNPEIVARAARVFLDGEGPGYIGLYTEDHASGATITKFTPGSAGEKAGLRVGDVIREVEGNPIRDGSHLGWLVKTFEAGITITIAHERDGTIRNTGVTLGGMDEAMLNQTRFRLLAGMLDVEGAMQYANYTVSFSEVVHLLEETRGSLAALNWITKAIDEPSGGIQAALKWQLLWDRAKLLERMGRWRDAITDLQAVHVVHGNFPPLNDEIGQVLWRFKQYDDAVANFEAAIEQASWGQSGMIYMLGLRLKEIGRKEAAREAFERIVDDEDYGEMVRKEISDL